MRYARALLISLFVMAVMGGAVLAVLAMPVAAPGDTPLVDPSPSVEPTATPAPLAPASAATVRHALKQRDRAQRALRLYRRHAACFLLHPKSHVAPRPARGASEAVWLRAGKRWHRQAHKFQAAARRLHNRMVDPGGSGATRWMPLARHVGWPSYTLDTLAVIILRESGGRPDAHNQSGASGLMQLMPGWFLGSWGMPAGNPFDPHYNLDTSFSMWKREGWRPWALTAY